ncbi:MAG TPA: DUF3798 domain-containing protein, partial [Holophaga sp.]|nr:DUF3798 domain-containing protein [Holophaga sp.]
AHTEPLVRQVIADKHAIFVEPLYGSPLLGYPGALGLDLSAEKGNWPAIIKKIEQSVKAKGAAGRVGSWSYSTGFSFTAGLGELGKRVVEGKAKLSNPKDVYAAIGKYTPGASWSGSFYTDMSTGVRAKNEMLLFMDTYIYGKGYSGTTKVKVPEKFFTIKKK